jgi:hypothetical protein
MNQSDAEAKRLEQEGIALLNQSKPHNERSAALARESGRHSTESIRLFQAAKDAGAKTKEGAKLLAEANRWIRMR